jgi:hypothetical protein
VRESGRGPTASKDARSKPRSASCVRVVRHMRWPPLDVADELVEEKLAKLNINAAPAGKVDDPRAYWNPNARRHGFVE